MCIYCIPLFSLMIVIIIHFRIFFVFYSDIHVHVPLNGAVQTCQRKRNHSDCHISVDDSGDAKKHHDDVNTSSNTSSGGKYKINFNS